ncbi:MAG: nucleotidyl cyclase domain-containing protein, partial [Planctomycetota bacterium]
MTPGRRAALHNVITAAVAVTTAALTYLHFDGRSNATQDARTQVVKVHDQVRIALEDEIRKLVGDKKSGKPVLLNWEPGMDLPEGFSSIGRHEGSRQETPHGLRKPEGDPKLLQREVHVGNTFSDTTQSLEGATTLGNIPFETALQFTGEGEGTLEVSAGFVDPPAEGVEPVSVQVLFGKAPEEPVLLGVIKTGDEPAVFDLSVTDDVRTRRHSLVLRVPPDVAPVKANWKATIGRAAQQEVVIAVWREITQPKTLDAEVEDDLTVRVPERTIKVPFELEDGTVEEREITLPAEDLTGRFDGTVRNARVDEVWKGYLLGRVNLDLLAERIRDVLEGPEFDTEQWGDRLYLTDASGNIALAIPDLHDKAKERAKREGRNSLASLATQQVKLRNPGTETYEGFSGFAVIGAYGGIEHINGGLVVEREEKAVLEPWRGLQAWHLSAILFGLLLVYPLVPPLVRRIRRDTEIPRLMGFAKPFVPHIM